jgi:pimeloyl-ACP methyl ester carboxylesterase
MSPKSGRLFAEFMEAASDDRIVIAPDYPGYGESDLPPEDPPVRVQDYARTMWEILDALNIDKVDLFGHHTGSKVAAEMAHQRPNGVGSIVMVSALVLTKEEQEKFENTYQPVPLDTEGTRFEKMWDAIVFHRGPGMTLENMATSMGESMRGGEAYEWGHAAAFAYNKFFPDVVKSLSHKVAVINPNDDLVEITPRVMDLLQNGTLLNKPEWGHGFLDAFTDDAVAVVKAALG